MQETKTPKLKNAWLMAAGVTVLIFLVGGGILLMAKEGTGQGLERGSTRATLENRIDELESILKDESLEADEKVSRALDSIQNDKALDKQSLDRADRDPFASPFWDDNWDPFQEMERMRGQMDRLFGDSMQRMKLNSFDDMKAPDFWSPHGEFEETDRAYIYHFDIPGVEKSEIHVKVEDCRLVVDGNRESRIDDRTDKDARAKREILYGKFHREIELPADIDIAGMKLKLDDGVLTITIPKKEIEENGSVKEIPVQ